MNRLFDYKRRYIASDGDEYIYMGSKAYNVSRLKVMNMSRLSEDYNGRIDKFNFANLKSRDDIDLVMYINHIYNPFAIKEGDILYAPSSDDFYYTTEEPTLIDGSKHSEYVSTSKKKTYAETVEYLAKMGLGIK